MSEKYYVTWEDLLEHYGTYQANPFAGVNALLGSNNFETVLGFSDALLAEYFMDLYSDRICAFPVEALEAVTSSKAYARTKRLITNVVRDNQKKYIAALAMLESDYNPIENYNMTEKEANGVKLDKSKTKSGADDGYSTTTSVRGHQITETKVAPFDSGTYNNQTKVEQYYEGADNPGSTTTIQGNLVSESEPTNSKGTSFTDSTYSIGTDNNQVSDRVLTRSGNIGVTTTQQMWEQELELKGRKIVEEFFADVKEKVLLSCF